MKQYCKEHQEKSALHCDILSIGTTIFCICQTPTNSRIRNSNNTSINKSINNENRSSSNIPVFNDFYQNGRQHGNDSDE
jgi:hypothetical protein